MELTLENWREILTDEPCNHGIGANYILAKIEKLLTLQRQATIAECKREFVYDLEKIRLRGVYEEMLIAKYSPSEDTDKGDK